MACVIRLWWIGFWQSFVAAAEITQQVSEKETATENGF